MTPTSAAPSSSTRAESSPLHQAPAHAPAPVARPAAQPPRRIHNGSATLAAAQSLGYIIVVAIFIVTFSLQPFRIPSASMQPTLLVGDFLLVNKEEPTSRHLLNPFPSSPIRRGDVIVFHYPVDPSLHLVKRVIGLPGDRLRMRDGHVFINGHPLSEPYAIATPAPRDSFRDNFPHLQTTDPDVSARWWSQLQHLVQNGELHIPPGHYFVLGDNRNNSEDSRYWGLVPRAAIVGEPFLVYFSLADPTETPTLGHDATTTPTEATSPTDARRVLSHFARWHRILHVIH